jgi:hypothetical protein
MKPCHAATLALMGWYLMSPPIRPGSGVDLRAPISQWDQDDDFDSAAACDEARAKRIGLAKTLAARIQEKLEKLDRDVGSASLSDEQAAKLNRGLDQETPRLDKISNLLKSMRASKCIASDDPRLKEK